MHTPAIDAVIRLMERLPLTAQDRVVEHLREYIHSIEREIDAEKIPEEDIRELDEL